MCLIGKLLNFSVNVAVVPESHFTCAADCPVLEDGYVFLSAYCSRISVRVSLLIRHSLNADVNLVLADDGSRLVVAYDTVKSFKFQVAAVHAPNIAAERGGVFSG